MTSSSMAALFRDEERAHLAEMGGSASSLPQNISQVERWASIGIGTAMVLAGLSRGKLGGFLSCIAGGAMLHRGITAHCYGYDMLGIDTAEHNEATAVPAQQGTKVEKTITIRKPASELFRYWRNFENLPRIMQHLESVQVLDGNKSHWVAEGVGGKSVEWYAEIINERDSELIAWRSLPGGDIDSAGSVHFKSLPNDRGTEVKVSMKYNPPGGKFAATVAEWLGVGAEQKVIEDLRRFKQLMETGDASSIAGQQIG